MARCRAARRRIWVGVAEKKELLRHVYTELSRGNPEPLLASLAEDIERTIIGTTVLAVRRAASRG